MHPRWVAHLFADKQGGMVFLAGMIAITIVEQY